MEIILNGISYTTNSENLYDLINEKKLNPLTVVVEMNRKIIRKEFWRSQEISDGDVIEILNFVGGG